MAVAEQGHTLRAELMHELIISVCSFVPGAARGPVSVRPLSELKRISNASFRTL